MNISRLVKYKNTYLSLEVKYFIILKHSFVYKAVNENWVVYKKYIDLYPVNLHGKLN